MNIWQTPHGMDFVREAVAILENGNCLAIVPDTYRRDFISAVASESEKQGCPCERIEAREDAFASLNPHFIQEGGAIEELPALALARGHYAVMEYDANSHGWVGDLLRCSGASEKRLWNILCIASPGTEPVSGFTRIAWWGRLRPSDTLYAIEKSAEIRNLGLAASCWHSAMCQALCELDIALIPRLVEEAPVTPGEIFEFLAGLSLASPEIGDIVRRFNRAQPFLSPEREPAEEVVIQLWKRGALDIAWDGRIVLHPAAMLAAGMVKELKVQLTAAQARIYLPLTGAVQTLISQKMESGIGIGWDAPKSSEEDENHLREIGPLWSWLRRHYPFEAREEIRIAEIWTDIRHCVAHSDFMPVMLAMKGVARYQMLKQAIN